MMLDAVVPLVRCVTCQQPRPLGEYRVVHSAGARPRRRRTCLTCERRFDVIRKGCLEAAALKAQEQSRSEQEIEARILKLKMAIQTKGRYLTYAELDRVLEPIPNSKPPVHRDRHDRRDDRLRK
ncbi:MAG: hypothetical protein U0790_25165 [Isosphaeraceae bacterium]